MNGLSPFAFLAFLLPLDAALDDEGTFLLILELDDREGAAAKIDDFLVWSEALGGLHPIVDTIEVGGETGLPIGADGARQVEYRLRADRTEGGLRGRQGHGGISSILAAGIAFTALAAPPETTAATAPALAFLTTLAAGLLLALGAFPIIPLPILARLLCADPLVASSFLARRLFLPLPLIAAAGIPLSLIRRIALGRLPRFGSGTPLFAARPASAASSSAIATSSLRARPLAILRPLISSFV